MCLRPVLTLLSGSSIQLLFGAAILCTCPAKHLLRLPPDLAIIVACGITVESVLTCKTSSQEELWSAMVIWYSMYLKANSVGNTHISGPGSPAFPVSFLQWPWKQKHANPTSCVCVDMLYSPEGSLACWQGGQTQILVATICLPMLYWVTESAG